MFKFSNEMDTRNRDIINSIVRKHFYLDTQSRSKFTEGLYAPVIDKTYERYLKNDLRYRVEIPERLQENFDRGFKHFKMFKTFIEKYNVKYSDFRQNKILHEKNVLKIFKLLTKFYHENKRHFFRDVFSCNEEQAKDRIIDINDIDSFLLNNMDEINSIRFPPNKKIYFVLSLNFADWFLCSTSESWGSCLSLESSCDGMYWTGLPGLITDKNRAMVYITTGEKKIFCDIVVDKVLSRSWTLLDENDCIKVIKFYPQKFVKVCELRKFLEIEGIKFLKKGEAFRSKYPIDLLYFDNDVSSYIYQDRTCFNDEKHLIDSSGGMLYFNRNARYQDEGQIFRGGKLSEVIRSGKGIGNYLYEESCCCDCGDRVVEENMHDINGNIFCSDCFYDRYFYCSSCGETYSVDSGYNNRDGEMFCSSCFHEDNFYCTDCGGVFYLDEAKEFDNDLFCEKCYKDKIDKK